jgi:ATP-dependent Clp protease ATP-binding subunit ClpC
LTSPPPAAERVFERFSESARHVVVHAQEEARLLGHPHIGTEHQLLGLLRDPGTIAGRGLASLGVTLDDARERVVAILGRRDEVRQGQMPFTPRAKAVLQGSLQEALELGHVEVGPEHLLLSLTRRSDGNGTRVLHEAGAEPDAIRGKVIEIMSAEPPAAAPPARADADAVAPRFSVGPDPMARGLLRAAAAHALADDREAYGPEDIRAALDGGQPPR